MSRKGKNVPKNEKSQVAAEPAGEGVIPSWLARSPVFRNLPNAVRKRINRALLTRPEDCLTPKAIAEQLDLQRRYGVSLPALQRYARNLEKYLRPIAGSQLMANILGCMPVSYRREIAAGGLVILLSKVMNALMHEPAPAGETDKEKSKDPALSVVDLNRLASILGTIARRTPARGRASGRRGSGKPAGATDDVVALNDVNKLVEAVGTVYGLKWPPTK